MTADPAAAPRSRSTQPESIGNEGRVRRAALMVLTAGAGLAAGLGAGSAAPLLLAGLAVALASLNGYSKAYSP